MRPLALALAALVLLGGCAKPGVSADSTSEAFPADTAQDWVTYGDFFVELEPVSEETLPPDENERFAGEGLFRRQFTLTVEKVWWRRSGVRDRPPTSQKWVSGGWQFRNGNLEGRTPAEAGELLGRTRPDPDVVPFPRGEPAGPLPARRGRQVASRYASPAQALSRRAPARLPAHRGLVSVRRQMTDC
jgi:hypothetical protein